MSYILLLSKRSRLHPFMHLDRSDFHKVFLGFKYRQNHLAFIANQLCFIRCTENHLKFLFFHKLKHDLKIDVLSSHKFRHLYATALLKNGADIFTVKQLLGHSKLENTQRYLDFTNEELKQNNFKYNPLNNFK